MALPSVIDEIDRLFDELVRRPWGTSRQLVPLQFREVEGGWSVDIPVAELRAADVKVEVHDRQLTVSGRRRRGQGERQGKGWTHTQAEVTWYRTIPLPIEADPDAIEASVQGSTVSIHVGRRKR